jgi:hypothetical protein
VTSETSAAQRQVLGSDDTSPARPSWIDRARQAAVTACTVGGLASGLVGNYRRIEGADASLTPPDWAFGIWGPVYAGSLAYASYQARPSLGADPELRRLGWPAALAYLGAGLWIRTSGDAPAYLTAVGTTTASALLAHGLLDPESRTGAARQWAVRVPVSAFAGWLTVAAGVSVSEPLGRLLGADQHAFDRAAAVPALAATSLVALTTTATTYRTCAYPTAVAWGLGTLAWRQQHREPQLAVAAAGAASAVLGVAAVQEARRWRRRRSSK